jgi:CheY-like chemotaxis protein
LIARPSRSSVFRRTGSISESAIWPIIIRSISLSERSDELALKALSRQDGKAPDLILLDLNLPTIDGIAVLIQIRNMPRLSGVPVVILTSSGSSSDMRRTERLGAARYIRKPFMLEDFLREVGGGVEEMLRESG